MKNKTIMKQKNINHKYYYIKDGEHQYFYEDGTIKRIITLNYGKLVSDRSYVNQQLINGTYEEIIDGCKTIWNYKDGMKNGKMTTYYENNMKHGNFIKFFETESETIKNNYTYNNNILIKKTKYHDNGNIKMNYDPQTNIIIFYDIDGKIIDNNNGLLKKI